MCGARAVFGHLNILLAMAGGALAVACGVVWSGEAAERARAVPAAGAVLLAPYVAAPLLLLLAHAALAALLAAPNVARPLLAVYAACCLLAVLAAAAVLSWAASQLVPWLIKDPAAGAVLAARPEARAWLAPLFVLLPEATAALHVFPPAPVRGEVAAVWALCGALLAAVCACAGLALCARPPRRARSRSDLRRCSSVYYEPSAPPPAYKGAPAPLGGAARWQ